MSWPSSEDESQSQTDTSDDSLDLRTRPVTAPARRNKRKLSEPRRVLTSSPPKKCREADGGEEEKPLPILNRKQRILAGYRPAEERVPPTLQVPGPESLGPQTVPDVDSAHVLPSPTSSVSSPTSGVFPLTSSLDSESVHRREGSLCSSDEAPPSKKSYCPFRPWDHTPNRPRSQSPPDTVSPAPSSVSVSPSPSAVSATGAISPAFWSSLPFNCPTSAQFRSPRSNASEGVSSQLRAGRPKQRNYKSMTKERRIEANARERNRVHTISAAFDELRHHLPSMEAGGGGTAKLSKLSVVRIAAAYILALSRILGKDYSKGQNKPSVEDCVRQLTESLVTEGKVKVEQSCES